MTLREKQSIFLLNVAKLIIWAYDNGYELTGGELYRTQAQQDIYLESGLSKAKHSKHQDKLAIDLNIFVNGEWKNSRESYRPLAEYWKSLNPNNVAGFDWGWDANHFEMK